MLTLEATHRRNKRTTTNRQSGYVSFKSILPVLLAAVGVVMGILAFHESVMPAYNPRVIITEIMVENRGGQRDFFGDFSPWIELHNRSNDRVNLEGWYLTDTFKQAHRWAFPKHEMQPGERLLVFASGRDRRIPGREFHTNFKLDPQGEYLALTEPDGVTVASEFLPKYPAQVANIAYGLKEPLLEDSLGRRTELYAFLVEGTPGEPNGNRLEGEAPIIHFSEAHGFKKAAFELSLTCGDPDALIKYTLDGSEPSATHGFIYEAPFEIQRSSIVRASGILPGRRQSGVQARSYFFTEDIIRQSPDGTPPPGFPSPGYAQLYDYGMDPEIVDDPRYAPLMHDALTSIPSFSVIMDPADLFDDSKGIYANPGFDGRDWERKASIELLNSKYGPDFATSCGIRIRGGFSRSENNPKHSFRFFFRPDYGNPELNYPLFGKSGVQTFSHFDLRTSQNYSWSFQRDERALFLRDQFSRDTQRDMGHLHARGDFCHLYVNGHYWGLYNTCERPKAAFGARYFGGKVENFDVIKIVGRKPNTFGRSQNAYTIFASDGNLKAWHALWEGSYGQDLTTEKYLSLSQPQAESRETDILLDPVNLIDYMLIILYGGNRDSPVSGFMGNSRPNNWWGLRDRTANRGFQFLIWDAEHTLLKVDEDRLGPFDAGRTFDRSNPQWIWQQCLKNEEFRMLLSDRVYKHFFHGGALTPEACQERLSKRAKEIELAVIAESARWGDSPASRGRRQWSQSQPEAMNRDDHWLVELDRILNDYMPTRSRIVFQQLMIDTSGLSDGLLTKVQFVQVTPRGGSLKPDESISLSAPEGQVYYTLDGSDPRAVGGQISDAAQRSTGNLRLTKNATLKARAYHEGEWSALEDLTFQITPSP